MSDDLDRLQNYLLECQNKDLKRNNNDLKRKLEDKRKENEDKQKEIVKLKQDLSRAENKNNLLSISIHENSVSMRYLTMLGVTNHNLYTCINSTVDKSSQYINRLEAIIALKDHLARSLTT